MPTFACLPQLLAKRICQVVAPHDRTIAYHPNIQINLRSTLPSPRSMSQAADMPERGSPYRVRGLQDKSYVCGTSGARTVDATNV